MAELEKHPYAQAASDRARSTVPSDKAYPEDGLEHDMLEAFFFAQSCVKSDYVSNTQK